MIKLILMILTLCGLAYADYQNIDNAKLQQLKSQGVTIIDIRTEPEWHQSGVISSSLLITSHTERGFMYDAFKAELNKQGIKDNFILVCRSGNRSKELADRLSADGYKNFYNLQYGIKGWVKENKPTAKPIM